MGGRRLIARRSRAAGPFDGGGRWRGYSHCLLAGVFVFHVLLELLEISVDNRWITRRVTEEEAIIFLVVHAEESEERHHVLHCDFAEPRRDVASPSHEVIGGLADALFELCQFADVREAVFRLRWVELSAQVEEHFDPIVDVDVLVEELTHDGFGKMLQHGGGDPLALAFRPGFCVGPVGDIVEEWVIFVCA